MRAAGRAVAVAACALSIGAAGCGDGVQPGNGSEQWAADITSTRQVLFMYLTRDGTSVRGTGTLASLTNPGGESLTLTGTRTADSLRVFYTRQTGDPFRFVGRYAGLGIVGTLDGAEFVQVAVSFRAR